MVVLGLVLTGPSRGMAFLFNGNLTNDFTLILDFALRCILFLILLHSTSPYNGII
jgi:hypothetical protein